MKKIILILCALAFIVSCGSKENKVNSTPSTTSGSEGLEFAAITTFIGEYDIIRKDSQDCSNTIRIVSDCMGLKILSNGFNPAEEFCNINRGIQRFSHEGDNRTPPNPDRVSNGETRNVTLTGNVLSAELRLNERVSFTNTLTMNNNGILVKISNLKSRTSRCIYQKRL